MSDDPLQEPRLAAPSLLKRIQQRSLPEMVWSKEQKQLAGLEPAQGRAWLKRLSSGNKFIRQEAARNFHGLSPAAQRLLTVQAYQRARNQQLGLYFAAVILNSILVFMGGSGGAEWVGFSLFVALLIMSIMTTYLRTNRQQELAKNLLDQTQDPRLVPYLLTRLAMNRSHNRAPRQEFAGRNQRNALARLLPLVQESDLAEWTGTHWNYLLYYLTYPHEDMEITLGVLRVVSRFGNEKALRLVEALIKKRISPVHATLVGAAVGAAREALEANRLVLEAAVEECLPPLQELVAKQKQAQTLLRPSDGAATSAPDILLRPASAYTSETPAEQLLRPQNGE